MVVKSILATTDTTSQTNLPTYLNLKPSATTQIIITANKYHILIFEPLPQSFNIPTYATFRNPTNGAREAELQ